MAEISYRALIVEFVATTLLVFLGAGTAGRVEDDGALQVALVFGAVTAVLMYAIRHISGGHMNPVITMAVMMAQIGTENFNVVQSVLMMIVQLLGAIIGACLIPLTADEDDGYAINGVLPGHGVGHAFCAEMLGTFFVVYVFLQTSVSAENKDNRAVSPLAVGLAVFVVHCLLIPVSGCSINPARSLGSAVIYAIKGAAGARISFVHAKLWVFFLAPIVGSALAYGFFFIMDSADDNKADAEEAE